MFKKIALSTVIVIGFLTACNKNLDNNTDITPAVNDIETVKASIAGIVIDEKNIPIPGATVISNSQTTTTDMYGRFRFNNIDVSKNNGWVKIIKTGYFNGNRTFLTTAGRTHNLRIKLLSKKTDGTFSSSSGGTVTLSNGAKITLAANVVTDAAGNPYTGTVSVSMRWLDPLAGDLSYTMPGDLRGIAVNGAERVLETYGMQGVELTGSGGQTLNIGSGSTAALSFPIPSALQATAPATIPLWFFDETTGRWKEEGSAARVGNSYAAAVKHFTFWNCDLSLPMINLCINVTSSGQPLNNVTVRLRRAANPASVSFGQTDSLGNVCGAVPQNEILVLEILDPCGNTTYAQNIGPFTTNTSVAVVANIPAVNSLIITGTVVNCSNAPVTNGYANIYIANGNYYYAPVSAGGVFSVMVLNCSGTLNFSVVGVDNVTQQQGNPATGSGTTGTINVGTITACGNAAASRYINLLIDGIPYNWAEPNDSFIVSYNNLPAVYFSGAHQGAVGAIINVIQIGLQTLTGTGSYPFAGIEIRLDGSLGTTYVLQNFPAARVNITEYGPPLTGFISGNFNENVIFPGNIIRNAICSFRFRRP